MKKAGGRLCTLLRDAIGQRPVEKVGLFDPSAYVPVETVGFETVLPTG